MQCGTFHWHGVIVEPSERPSLELLCPEEKLQRRAFPDPCPCLLHKAGLERPHFRQMLCPERGEAWESLGWLML